MNKSHSSLLKLLMGATITVVISMQPVTLQAQSRPQPAPVPDAVTMPRPDSSEIRRTEELLADFIASLDGTDRSLFENYPYLLQVSPREINSAIVPDLQRRFQNQHEAQVEIAQAGDIDILFMGDSITDWWDSERENYAGKPVFDEYFGDLKVANFGIAGDTTQGVLYRLQNGEGEGFSPKVVMLMIGTNNTRTHFAGEIAEGVGAVVSQLQSNFPDANILLLGIFPRSTAVSDVRAEIVEINSIISRLDDGEKVFYQDIGEIFLDAEGNIPQDIMSDGLHPTTKGYQLWAEAVKGPLEELAR